MSKNCVDIIRPFTNELDSINNVQFVGGVGSFVLQNAGTEILIEDRLVIAPADIDYSNLGQFRKDGNKRDFDVLVKSTSEERRHEIESLAEATIDDALILSVFGLHAMAELQEQQYHPAKSLAKVWVADRYVTEENDQIIQAKKALYPFAVDIDLSSLENWHLIIGGEKPMPIPHPATVVLNYLTRAVYGLRPKDKDKIQELATNVFSSTPELLDWIVDGPGSSQFDFARVLQTLREPKKHGKALSIGGKLEVQPYSPDQIREHPAMLIKDSDGLDAFAIEISRAKARGTHFFERQEWIVTAYQKYAEPRLGFIVGNR
jgi:hypothetical protein